MIFMLTLLPYFYIKLIIIHLILLFIITHFLNRKACFSLNLCNDIHKIMAWIIQPYFINTFKNKYVAMKSEKYLSTYYLKWSHIS